MIPSPTLVTKVNMEVIKYVDLARDFFQIQMHIPTVKFADLGTDAGMANIVTGVITFNTNMLVENEDIFLKSTVPHEVAHLVDFMLNPESFIPRPGRRRQLHGKVFKYIMVRVFDANPSTTHTYKTKTKNPVMFVWKCINTDTIMKLSIRRHNKMKKGTKQYIPKSWNHKTRACFVFTGETTSN